MKIALGLAIIVAWAVAYSGFGAIVSLCTGAVAGTLFRLDAIEKPRRLRVALDVMLTVTLVLMTLWFLGALGEWVLAGVRD